MTYIDVHTSGLKGLTEEQFMDRARKTESEYKARDVELRELFFNLDEGKSFCICEASSPEPIREAHESAGLPIPDEVIPVKSID